MMEEIIDLLESVHPMSGSLKLLVREKAQRIAVPRGTILLSPGKVCDHLYYIEKGMLACYDEEGDKRYYTWLMVEKDIATSVESFNDQVPSAESIVAIEDCILWTLSWQHLEELSGRSKIFSRIRQRLTDKYHIQSRTLDAKRKRPPEQFYDYLSLKYPEIVRRVPNHILASYMGIVESTLYKIKRERRHYH